MNGFEPISLELLSLIEEWEPKLLALDNDVISASDKYLTGEGPSNSIWNGDGQMNL